MHWLWWLQIGADVVLLGAILVLLIRLKAPAASGGMTASTADLENFLEEADRLTREFDRLLGEKRELVRTTLNTLDARVTEMREMADELNKPAPAPPQTAPPVMDWDNMQDFRQTVLEMAGQGKDPVDIARATNRPRGEVELVLGLNGKTRS